MNNENSLSLSENEMFGEMLHSFDQKNPLSVGFGSCCCSCSSSAAVYVENSLN